jgi:phage protein D
MPILQYQISLGHTTLTPTSETALVSLTTEADLAIPVNTCRLVVAHPPTLAVGDAVEVKLGYDGTLQTVFKGEVAHLHWVFWGLEVEAVSHLWRLTTTYLNLLFEKSTAKAIVQDAAKRCQVSVDKATDGIQFPVYALGDQISVWDHLRHLAERCGFDLYGDRADKLVFAPYQPSQTHELTYGVDILAYHWSQRPSPLSGVEIYGESPASQGQGDKAYSWLTKKEVKGSSGNRNGTVLHRVEPTARTQAIAGTIATALLKAHQGQQQGWIEGLGNPAAGLGDRLSLDKLPTAAHNGRYKITGVRHRLSQQRGFCTTLQWQEEP